MEEIETEIEGNKDESGTVRIYRLTFFDTDHMGGTTTIPWASFCGRNKGRFQKIKMEI